MIRPIINIAYCIAALLFASMASAGKLQELEKSYHLQEGFVGVLYDPESDKTYLKINNLDSDFIYQTSLPHGLGSNDIGLDRGQLGETRLTTFRRAGNRVFLVQKPVDFRALTENSTEAEAVTEAFASSVLWGFPLVDSGDNWVLVDASDFILQDIHAVARRLRETEQGQGFKVDQTRSVLEPDWSRAFPDNTELRATITLVGDKPGDHLRAAAANPYAISLQMQHSFVRLPDDNYQPRQFYPKSGYWSVQFRDYAQPINQDINRRFIGRHRLQKQDPSAQSSAAIEPIVYYIDPGVPEPVRSALIDGALWWNQGFEALGYDNAFQVQTLPPEADPMDVRYNVIQWVHRSTRGWSYGSSVTDPRTGEIIKGHVTLGSLRVRQDYLIAQGMLAPFANSLDPEFVDDSALTELALARIRQLSAHEVGHTLGLAHNFAASAYGRESVMDYPHPLFELENGRVVATNAYAANLGAWDIAAIAYGYQQFADSDQVSARKIDDRLQAMLNDNDAKGLLYISDPDSRSPGSPHAQASLWDNGTDAVEELERVIELRAVALEQFGSANLQTNRPWSDLQETLVPVYYFHRYQIGAAAKFIGGLLYDYSIHTGNTAQSEGSSKKTEIVSAADQQRALEAMIQTLSPDFLALNTDLLALIPPKAAGYYRTRESVDGQTGVTFDPLTLAAGSAQHTLSLMLHPQRLARLEQQNATNTEIPSLASIGAALHKNVIDKEYQSIEAKIHQTLIDLIYSNYLNLLNDPAQARLVKAHAFDFLIRQHEFLEGKASQAKKNSRPGRNSGYDSFYQYQAARLKNLTAESGDKLIALPKMPPGSPI